MLNQHRLLTQPLFSTAVICLASVQISSAQSLSESEPTTPDAPPQASSFDPANSPPAATAAQPAEESSTKKRMVRGDGYMLWWSENNDLLRGFSHSFGKWVPLKIKPQKSISTIAGRQNGAVRLEDSVAVFNASSGRWDLLTLSKNSDAQLTSTANGFEIEDDGKFYTYSSRWTSPNDPDFEESEVTYVIRNIPASRMIA